MLLAEMDPDLKGALVGFLLILTLVLQSWFADWRQKRAAADLAVKVSEAAAKVDAATEKAEAAVATAATQAGKTTQVLGDVYSAVNGDGIGGRLTKVETDIGGIKALLAAVREEMKLVPMRAATAAVAAVMNEQNRPRAGG